MRIEYIEYFSCNIVLEVNVTSDGFTRREVVLARLPSDLLNDHDGAVQYVLPFVAAVQHGDEHAIEEVARALRENDYFDPTGFDPDKWLPYLLCRVGRCGRPVVSGLEYCTHHSPRGTGDEDDNPSAT